MEPQEVHSVHLDVAFSASDMFYHLDVSQSVSH